MWCLLQTCGALKTLCIFVYVFVTLFLFFYYFILCAILDFFCFCFITDLFCSTKLSARLFFAPQIYTYTNKHYILTAMYTVTTVARECNNSALPLIAAVTAFDFLLVFFSSSVHKVESKTKSMNFFGCHFFFFSFQLCYNSTTQYNQTIIIFCAFI